MQVKSIAECSKRAFYSTFDLHLATIFKAIVLSIFELPLKTGFTVVSNKTPWVKVLQIVLRIEIFEADFPQKVNLKILN